MFGYLVIARNSYSYVKTIHYELLIMTLSLEIFFITDILNFHYQHLTEKVQRKQSAKLMQRTLKDTTSPGEVDIKARNVHTIICYKKNKKC